MTVTETRPATPAETDETRINGQPDPEPERDDDEDWLWT